MAHDVFISYKSEEFEQAEGVCRALELAGLPCWMAPREIPYGSNYPRAVVDGIKSAHALVLLLSRRANESEWVADEVERAKNYGLRIILFRLENVEPSEDLELMVSRTQRLDAFPPPIDAYTSRLAVAVKSQVAERKAELAQREAAAAEASRRKAASEAPQAGKDNRGFVTIPAAKARAGGKVRITVAENEQQLPFPAGITDGTEQYFAGLGEPGIHGGPAGALILTFRVTPEPVASEPAPDFDLDETAGAPPPSRPEAPKASAGAATEANRTYAAAPDEPKASSPIEEPNTSSAYSWPRIKESLLFVGKVVGTLLLLLWAAIFASFTSDPTLNGPASFLFWAAAAASAARILSVLPKGLAAAITNRASGPDTTSAPNGPNPNRELIRRRAAWLVIMYYWGIWVAYDLSVCMRFARGHGLGESVFYRLAGFGLAFAPVLDRRAMMFAYVAAGLYVLMLFLPLGHLFLVF